MFDIYECNHDDSARFLLGISGEPTLFVVGLNPSTASSEKSDTTVSKVRKIAKNAGYNGFVMTNLYPLRSKDPHALPQLHNVELLAKNIRHIERVASKDANPVFWAALGSDIVLRTYLKDAMIELNDLVQRVNGKWVQYGELTKTNHPRHPSRLSYAWQFSDYDVTKQVKSNT
jgi:hypothetical protein